MADEPLSSYTRDLFLRLAAMRPGDSDAVEFSIQQTINRAVADERSRCARLADAEAETANQSDASDVFKDGAVHASYSIAAAIRAQALE